MVRRVRQLDPRVNPGQEGELLAGWRYHGFVTDTTFFTVEADLTHRAHAVTRAGLRRPDRRPLAHLPSGWFGANSAWLLCAVIAHNLMRAASTLTGASGARPGPRRHPAPPRNDHSKPAVDPDSGSPWRSA